MGPALVLAFLCATSLVGCSGADDAEEVPRPRGSTTAPVESWRATPPERLASFRRAAGDVDAGLDRTELLEVGIEACRAMFAVRTDDEIAETIQRVARDLLAVDLSVRQAAKLITPANNFVCPELEK